MVEGGEGLLVGERREDCMIFDCIDVDIVGGGKGG